MKAFISYTHDSTEQMGRVWDLCERLRKGGIEALGRQHPDVATSLHNLALLYKLRGKYPGRPSRSISGRSVFGKGAGAGAPQCGHAPQELRSPAAEDQSRDAGRGIGSPRPGHPCQARETIVSRVLADSGIQSA